MNCTKLAVVPFLLLLGAAFTNEEPLHDCESIVHQWASSALESEIKQDKHVLQDLLFFLHVPRTGGRTYYHCFLKKLYPDFLECPRSYDKMRYDPRRTDCHLFSTHDDYSVMTKLPMDKTSVVTILRDPVDRVFSAYEFSIEVAARFLNHPNFTEASRTIDQLHEKTEKRGISTLNIWPWKYLVPWMIEDLFARKDARDQKGQASITGSNPYDMEDVLMPLHMYIGDPIAHDIIHNGATFQLAGLTNNSFLAESLQVRQCVLKYESLGQYVLNVAKRRLDAMLYVGLTENHRESTTVFADVVGAQVISQFIKSKFSKKFAAANDSGSSGLPSNFDVNHDSDRRNFSTESVNTVDENMTAEKLMDVYESCVKKLRRGMSQKRINSLANIHINFTKEGRSQVPQELLQEIRSLNHLDAELHKYAQHIFRKQQKHRMQPIEDAEQMENELDKPNGPSWTFIFIVSSSVMLPLFFFLLKARNRELKIKP